MAREMSNKAFDTRRVRKIQENALNREVWLRDWMTGSDTESLVTNLRALGRFHGQAALEQEEGAEKNPKVKGHVAGVER